MLKKNDVFMAILFLLILIVSIAMFCVNRFWYRFPGLFYFEPSFLGCAIFLFMVYFGLKLQFGLSHDLGILKMIRAANLYAGIMVVILFATSAIQYTPFSLIDKKILMIEHYFHVDLQASIEWLGKKGTIRSVVNAIYDSLTYQLIIIPLWVLCWRKYETLYNFYCLALTSWLIGSLIYYFFPTAGPASVIDSSFFSESQRATGLKFWQLHHYIQPVTADGGLIAMPSFHVIWAWLCVYLLRPWPVLYVLCGAMNIILVAACVFLGWHYFLDVVGSAITLFISHYLLRVCYKRP